MGVFVPGPNVVQVAMLYTVLGEICENVYHVHRDTAWTSPDMVTLNGIFSSWENSDGKAMRHNSTQLFKVSSVDLTTQNGLFVDTPLVPGVTGVQTGPAPNNVTIAIKWSTGARGRSFRGRTFHVGMYEAAFAGNQLTTAANADWTTRYGDLLTAVDAFSTCKLVVFSRRSGKAYRLVGVATPIAGISINPNLDSQRRRLPEHNRHR